MYWCSTIKKAYQQPSSPHASFSNFICLLGHLLLLLNPVIRAHPKHSGNPLFFCLGAMHRGQTIFGSDACGLRVRNLLSVRVLRILWHFTRDISRSSTPSCFGRREPFSNDGGRSWYYGGIVIVYCCTFNI